MYRHFDDTRRQVKQLIEHSKKLGIQIECKIYSHTPPTFSISCNKFSLAEHLILGESQNINTKLAGKMPLMEYGSGKVKEAIDNNFKFIWDNISTPLEDFYEEVESKYFLINQFLILSNLQSLYWEKQWRIRDRFNKHNPLYSKFKSILEEKEKSLRILDLGCGNGGGGALDFLNDSLSNNHSIEFVDVSEEAIEKFKTICRKKSIGLNNPKVSFSSSDILTYISEKEDDSYDFIYSNLAIIYMPRIKTMEIFQQIHRKLKSNGVFAGLFWHNNYFNMAKGESQDKQNRPGLKFLKIPLYENLQIVINGNRKGEIRRFYRNKEELMDELTTIDGFDTQSKNVFSKENCEISYYGDFDQNLILKAIKK